MESWIASYEDRGNAGRTVESRTALDAAKDFALLVPRGDDCTVVVSSAASPGERLLFDRRSGVFRERLPPPPLPPVVPPVAPESLPASPSRPAPSGDTFSYRGWLISDSFLKRCFAVVGYAAVGNALIALAIWLLFFGALGGCLWLGHLLSPR
jgi:hypothetical protein